MLARYGFSGDEGIPPSENYAIQGQPNNNQQDYQETASEIVDKSTFVRVGAWIFWILALLVNLIATICFIYGFVSANRNEDFTVYLDSSNSFASNNQIMIIFSLIVFVPFFVCCIIYACTKLKHACFYFMCFVPFIYLAFLCAFFFIRSEFIF
jgi:hypothetical protein